MHILIALYIIYYTFVKFNCKNCVFYLQKQQVYVIIKQKINRNGELMNKNYSLNQFVQGDLYVLYMQNGYEFPKNTSDYYILIVLSGKAKIKYKDSVYIANSGEIHIANASEKFFCETSGSTLKINFNASVFNNFDKNYDILKPFNNTERLKIYKTLENKAIKSGFDNLIEALNRHSSRVFVVSAILQILCEINNTFSRTEKSFEYRENDSNYAKIMSYIDAHLFDNVTLEDISKNVFLSKKCINDTVKRISGNTCHQAILKRRCDEAEHLLKHSNYSLKEISVKCGFDTYSTFHRNYVKNKKTTPGEVVEKYRDFII